MERVLSSYEGLAEVLVNGERYPCQVDLRRGEDLHRDPVGGPPIPGLPWWRGTITMDEDSSAQTVEGVEYAALLINGRGANFRVIGRQGRRLSIRSNGSLAPFD